MTAPQFAFFDVDDTLVAFKTMFDFFPFWCAENGARHLVPEFEARFSAARAAGLPRQELNRLYYRFFRGAALPTVVAVGQAWFLDRFKRGRAPYFTSTVVRLKRHQAEGVQPVLVSGSMPPLLDPIARDLGVAHQLCTQLLVDDYGVLTGELAAPPTIGAGKASALMAFLTAHGAAASACFAYGDDSSDVPMLEAVGTAVAVGSAADLLATARLRGWAHLAV
jgi:HAD superfamily hydrolase (TIGR01490 family)